MAHDPWSTARSEGPAADTFTAAPTHADPWATQQVPTVPAPPDLRPGGEDEELGHTVVATTPFGLDPLPVLPEADAPASPTVSEFEPPATEWTPRPAFDTGTVTQAVIVGRVGDSGSSGVSPGAAPVPPGGPAEAYVPPPFTPAIQAEPVPATPMPPIPPGGPAELYAPLPPVVPALPPAAGMPPIPPGGPGDLSPAPVPAAAPVVPETERTQTGAGEDSTVAVSRYGPHEWVLRLPGGGRLPIDRALVLGRRPDPQAAGPEARLVALDDPERTVSRTHALAEPVAGGFLLRNVSAVNALVLVAPDGSEAEVDPGGAITVTGACTVILGAFPIEVERVE